MRILFLYPPPWKIPAQGEESDQSGEGPPESLSPGFRFEGDEVTVPYGLLTLAAQSKRAGHDVLLLNIFMFAWRDLMCIPCTITLNATPGVSIQWDREARSGPGVKERWELHRKNERIPHCLLERSEDPVGWEASPTKLADRQSQVLHLYGQSYA